MAVYESSYGKDMRTLSFNILDLDRIVDDYSSQYGVDSYHETGFTFEYGDADEGHSNSLGGVFDFFIGDNPEGDGPYYQLDSFLGEVNRFAHSWHYHDYDGNPEQYHAGSHEISGIALDSSYFTGGYADAYVAALVFQGNDQINGSDGKDYLLGYAGNDTLRGGDGHDTLDGGRGEDMMIGGEGNDTFLVDNKRDVVLEHVKEGTDLVRASVSHALSAHVENLTLTGTKALNGIGNGLANVMTGNAGKNTLKGGGGGDTLKGGAGSDRLYGGTGSDKLSGGTGGDVLDGGTGNDRIHGGTGHDRLWGGSGRDLLKGEAGNDKLYGGAGADKLHGGSGRDTFVFKSVKDSTVSASGRDTIYDFSRKQGDGIDLKAIDADATARGNQAFTFIGSEKFHGKAGELRYQKKGGDTFVSGDVDGDGKADFAIKVDASLTFAKADFLL